jgi:hypothetical protein
MSDRQKYVVSFIDDFHFTATSPEDAAMSLIEFIAKHGDHLRIQVHTPLSSVIIEPQFIELDAYGNPILNGHPVERFGWND